MDPELCQVLAVALEELIWGLSPEVLAAAEPAARELVAAAGVPLAEVLAEMSDESLALAVQKRFLRREAFEECLVKRQEARLQRWFTARTGSREHGQDLTQELYVHLLGNRGLGSYDPSRPFSAWLWTVAHHLWVNFIRRRRDQPGLTFDLEDPRRGTDPTLDEVVVRELEGRLEAALAGLPELQQRILRGAMAGQTADGLAEELGLPKSAVYQNLFRARRQAEEIMGLPAAGAGLASGL
jgi:RNA polymerase sigma-70 factor (ECF subfamily)